MTAGGANLDSKGTSVNRGQTPAWYSTAFLCFPARLRVYEQALANGRSAGRQGITQWPSNASLVEIRHLGAQCHDTTRAEPAKQEANNGSDCSIH